MNTKTDLTVGGDKLPPLIPRTMNRLTAPKSGPAAMLRLHRWIYARSDGRVGAGMIGAWTLLLRTVGRRTGQPRLTALVFRGTGKDHCGRLEQRKGSRTGLVPQLVRQTGSRSPGGSQAVPWKGHGHRLDGSRLSTALGTHERDQQQAV